MNEHPSELDLLRALDGSATDPTTEHLARCGECGGRVAEVRGLSELTRRAYEPAPAGSPSPALERRMADAERRALATQPEAAPAEAPGFRRLPSWRVLAGTLSAAAAIVLGVILVSPKRETVGLSECAILADRTAGLRSEAGPIAEARSGERYRLRLALEQTSYVALFNLDTSGALNLFFPFEEAPGRISRFDLSPPFPAGRPIELPPETHVGYRLDARPGKEWYYLVASRREIAEADLLAIVREFPALPVESKTPEAVRIRLAGRFGTVRVLSLEHRP